MSQSDSVELLDVEVLEVTPDAILVEIDSEPTWIPTDAICGESDIGAESSPGDVGMLIVTIDWAADHLFETE